MSLMAYLCRVVLINVFWIHAPGSSLLEAPDVVIEYPYPIVIISDSTASRIGAYRLVFRHIVGPFYRSSVSCT